MVCSSENSRKTGNVWPVSSLFLARFGSGLGSGLGLDVGLGLRPCLAPTIGGVSLPENSPDPWKIRPKSLSRGLLQT